MKKLKLKVFQRLVNFASKKQINLLYPPIRGSAN